MQSQKYIIFNGKSQGKKIRFQGSNQSLTKNCSSTNDKIINFTEKKIL